jgi:DNA-binding IclR family transcriptional regulator
MRKPGDWMQNPTDERILEVLNTGLELGPTTIGRNIDRDRTGVSRRLSVLVEYGLVARVDEGYSVLHKAA